MLHSAQHAEGKLVRHKVICCIHANVLIEPGERFASHPRRAFRKIEALYPLFRCESTKVDPLLFGRLNWKLGFLV
jgi:hypothetical protein